MKTKLQSLLLSSLLLLGVSGCQVSSSESQPTPETETTSDALQVQLSPVAVEFVEGETLTGRYLKGLTAAEITVEYNGQEESFTLDEVENVRFLGDAKLGGSGELPSVRGDETLIVEPIEGFEVKDSRTAEIKREALKNEPDSSFNLAATKLTVREDSDDGMTLELEVIAQD